MSLFYRIRSLVFLLATCLLACNGAEDEQPISGAAQTSLRVMTFNIEWGGTNVSFDNVVEAIRRSNADIVGIQEAQGNLQRLAGELGWHYDLRNYVVSRFPLIDPPGADGKFVYVEVASEQVVTIANVHLPSDPDGMAAVRDGATAIEVLEIERTTRLPKIEPYLAALSPLLDSGDPLFVTGDFNAPSHTDWIAATVGARPFLRYALEWPVSMAMNAAGFHDAWREVYPDPLINPGLTWWAARPPLDLYIPGENDPEERIDFIWYAGAVSVQSIVLAGEPEGPEVTISVAPWPSDHRGVVAQFSVIPAAMPALLTTDRRIYWTGEDIHVRYHAAGDIPAQLAIEDMATQATVTMSQTSGADGRMVFEAQLFPAGHYKVTLNAMTREFWVIDSDAIPVVEVNKDRYQPGEAIEISWRDAPGNRNDYVAVYRADVEAAYGGELAWAYVNALPAGDLRLGRVTAESGWPLGPGAYVIRLIEDDGYDQLAESTVFVVEP